ncbi:MAG TPA: discoidin domain-containing protein, partial [Oscillatoriaceae cyanobacterium]
MAPFEIGRLVRTSLLATALFAAQTSVGGHAADAAETDGAAVRSVDVLAVTASSTDGMLMDAVDGDSTTAWQARAGVRDAWLAVRLEHAASLGAVSLQTGPMAKGETLAVETSQDGTHYTTQL